MAEIMVARFILFFNRFLSFFDIWQMGERQKACRTIIFHIPKTTGAAFARKTAPV
jgi:hypothetical protein